MLADKDTLLVGIITLDGDEFDEVANVTAEELAAHLAQWDYGTENDGAATINGYTSIDEAERFGAQIVTYDGIKYWLSVDHNMRMCSQLRLPLTSTAQEG
jgi:hypothetical protein